MGAPMRYPAPQLVTIMPIATETLADPKTLPTTVGIVAKKPPFAIPLITTKIARGARLFEAGQTTSILMALTLSDRSKEFRGPIMSHRTPLTTLPTADAKLNPAKSPAPVPEVIPRARV